MKKLAVGGRVKYRREFLQSICCYTGDLPFARGVIRELKICGQVTIATIEWDGPDVPSRVNVANLTPASDPERM